MILNNLINKLCFIFHWNIGFIETDLNSLFNNSFTIENVKWLKDKKDRFFADPFILDVTDSIIEVLVEEYIYSKHKGTITLLEIQKGTYELIDEKVLLDLPTHLSFPFIFRENTSVYVIPENSQSGELYLYEYDNVKKTLEFKKVLLELPVVDPCIFKHNNIYYLFCTIAGKNEDADLYVFFSDSLEGNYKGFDNNPVKRGLAGSRSGGDIFLYGDNLYRVAQNSVNSYGESISINKIINFDIGIFDEEKASVLQPGKDYPCGLHTLNTYKGITVIDGLNYNFSPLQKLKLKYNSYANKN
jgi:hypothetical protein